MNKAKKYGKRRIRIYQGALIGVVNQHGLYKLDHTIEVTAERWMKGSTLHGWTFIYERRHCWLPFRLAEILGVVIDDSIKSKPGTVKCELCGEYKLPEKFYRDSDNKVISECKFCLSVGTNVRNKS